MFLEDLGYAFLRFPEYLVVYRIDEVIAETDFAIKCLEHNKVDKSNFMHEIPL